MKVGRAGRVVVMLVAAAFVVCCASAAVAQLSEEDQTVLNDLQALKAAPAQAKTPEEHLAKLKETLPKFAALAEKNANKRFGPEILYFGARAAMQARDMETAKAFLHKFLKQYPDHRGVGEIKAMLAEVKLIGTDAKAFETTDLDGKPVKLADYKGKVVLLDFFASWCGPCVGEMPNVIKVYEKFNARGFEIVGISLDRTADAARKYVKDAGIKWTVTWQKPGFWNNPVARLYGIQGIPATYLLDEEGKILHIGLRGEALANVLATLFPEPKKAEKQEDADEEPAPDKEEMEE